MRKYHFSYDRIGDAKIQKDEETITMDNLGSGIRNELIKFFLGKCKCTNINSYNESAMILETETQCFDFLKNQINTYLKKYFHYSFSLVSIGEEDNNSTRFIDHNFDKTHLANFVIDVKKVKALADKKSLFC